jgi:hypothetical protein
MSHKINSKFAFDIALSTEMWTVYNWNNMIHFLLLAKVAYVCHQCLLNSVQIATLFQIV